MLAGLKVSYNDWIIEWRGQGQSDWKNNNLLGFEINTLPCCKGIMPKQKKKKKKPLKLRRGGG